MGSEVKRGTFLKKKLPLLNKPKQVFAKKLHKVSEEAETDNKVKKESGKREVEKTTLEQKEGESVVVDKQLKTAEAENIVEKAKAGNAKPGETAETGCGEQFIRALGSDKYKGTRQLEVIGQLARESGFLATGKTLRRYPADHFERTTHLKKYSTYLEENLNSGCNINGVQTESVLRQLKNFKQGTPFLAGSVTGVPGCGKSTLLQKIQFKAGLNSVIVLGNESLKSSFCSVPLCYTAKDLILLDFDLDFDVLLIDEYTLLNSGEILFLQRKCKAKVVIVFGDRAQGSSDTAGSSEFLFFPCVFAAQTSHRFGSEIAKLCGQCGHKFSGSPDIQDKVLYSDYDTGSSETTEANICFTEETQRDLREVDIASTLVEETQGRQFGSVTVFIRSEDREALKDPHWIAVAFTRSNCLTIRCPPNIEQEIEAGSLQNGYRSRTHTYGPQRNRC